jgi:hypothetical protein
VPAYHWELRCSTIENDHQPFPSRNVQRS